MENIGPLVATALRELGLRGASSGLQEEKERGGIRQRGAFSVSMLQRKFPSQFSNSQTARSFETVIASEAKQSIVPHKERMDCFASLAMTWNSKHTFAPRGATRPESLINLSPLGQHCSLDLFPGLAHFKIGFDR